MSVPKAYVRPTRGWWRKHPVYLRYMIREATSIFVVIYALILLYGLWSLVRGGSAYAAWLAGLSSPVSIAFHVLAMAAAAYHTITWFKVSPKVFPHLYVGTRRLPDRYITGVQYVIAGICYAALFIVTWRV